MATMYVAKEIYILMDVGRRS